VSQKSAALHSAVASLERAADRASGTVAVPGNAVRLLFDGPDIYEAMYAQIASATRRIHFENYIFRCDSTGEKFADALIARANEGIKVRVLYDWLGCFSTPRRFWRKMVDAGIEVRVFGPPQLRDPLAFIIRDHRKVLVVDGERGITGGHCIGNEWAGDPEKNQRPWRDTAVELTGPAARLLDQAFARVWNRAGGMAIDDASEVGPEVAEAGDITVRVVATEPGEQRASRTMEMLLGVSADRIWVTEPYLAGARRVFQVLEDASRDGVDVRLLMPGASDVPMVRNLSRTGYRRLLRSGVRLWEWNGSMLHAKTLSVDSRWIRVGSSNLNPSSLIANWELDVFMDSPELSQELERKYLDDLAESSEVVARDRPGLRWRKWQAPAAVVANAPVKERQAHRPGRFERRRNAFLRAAVLARGAQAALLGPLALVLLGFAALLVIFPKVVAYTTATIAAVSGITVLITSLARRPRG
jgi:cardiolipin synthase